MKGFLKDVRILFNQSSIISIKYFLQVEAKLPELNPLHFGVSGIMLDDIYLLALEPIGKRMFDCVLAHRPRQHDRWITGSPQLFPSTTFQHRSVASAPAGAPNPVFQYPYDNLTQFNRAAYANQDVATLQDPSLGQPLSAGESLVGHRPSVISLCHPYVTIHNADMI